MESLKLFNSFFSPYIDKDPAAESMLGALDIDGYMIVS
jgi:hypothetical protein